MYTILIILFVLFLVVSFIGLILSIIKYNIGFILLGWGLVFVCLIGSGLIYGCISLLITVQDSKTEVTTPNKYTNQTYYISKNERLYVQQNDTTKPFGGDISSKIEYKDSAKEPSIEFKTIKSFGDLDLWIPSKYKEEFKTSISKVILPKSALTEKLTKVNVLNQSDSNDLTLIN